MYTRSGGALPTTQSAVLSDSSSESLLSVTECRRACSRGLRRSVDPSSMWMEGISKWTGSASGGRVESALADWGGFRLTRGRGVQAGAVSVRKQGALVVPAAAGRETGPGL